MGLEINLGNAKDIILRPEEKISITKFRVNRMVDLPNEKIVRIFVDELNDPIVLWEGDAYDQIGNWTENDVDARLKELYS